jgi:hypothetical protein
MGAALAQRATPKKRAAFLDALERCGNVTQAAVAAGVDRRLMYRTRAADPEFAAKWDEAVELGADALEDEARRRAHDGVEEPLTCARGLILDDYGQPVTVRKYSDTLLIFLLKGARPEKYRDNIKVSGSLAHQLVPQGEARALADELLAAVQQFPEARAALSARLLASGE